ncbi:hypothetical protein [Williamsoniiplasma lucivorax]|uniref:Uncharacterized protein n=1 Tax=Williamsoniiplasma lucivorax TaxID=209274 RepID=A0A2S5RG90_9MOLU|nr:hypothetical protein [Williamsoniiplasma lucivorax]PPE06145.1 hypothetical protein ELUCI_v1c04360 [Williamsoniiplasma lucivorax]
MKKIPIKYKIFIPLLILYFIVSWALIIPGMGLDAKLFINSVSKQINRIMPKNKYVLDPNTKMYDVIMHGPVKNSYIADAVSTINFANQEEYDMHYDQYIAFATNWFNNRWGATIKNKEAIDFNDVANDMITFDEAVATKFHSFGFVHTGIEWIFHQDGMQELFSSNVQAMAEHQDFIWTQEYYDDQIELEMLPEMLGLRVKNSIGASIVNNKVWFLNKQVDSLKFALSMQILEKPFLDKTLQASDVTSYVGINDLYHPNFALTKNLMKAATIHWLLSFAIVTSATVYLVLKIKKIKNTNKMLHIPAEVK